MGFAPSSMQLSSPAFINGGEIPLPHTGEGPDTSPALNWSDAPENSQGFALICHDPDAPLVSPGGSYGFVHWVLYNIPGDVDSLAEGTEKYTQGINNFDNKGYNGPMPPEGHGVHQYYFWVLALDKNTDLPAGLTLWQLLDELEPHIIGMNRLIGTYERGVSPNNIDKEIAKAESEGMVMTPEPDPRA